MRLQFAAVSDVGRVRKDNQDSGYAGPWMLAVCDGVGGAARGDIASSTAVHQLRRLDVAPPDEHSDDDLTGEVAGALLRAHDRIAELVDHDPSLTSTSTTATVGRFDGQHLAIGHVGDSRAYLFRGGELQQLTHDHTFVQTLIDEGRITEEEARFHPHRNLILKALDGQRDAEPDLFTVPLEPGDRLMFCSDGVCGVLDAARIADVLGGGSPDFAATELVRTALEAGSSDNVTCVVADVVEGEGVSAEPQIVGAAGEAKRWKNPFRGHRTGDTGELEAIREEIRDDSDVPAGAIATDPLDPVAAEAMRYALRAPRRFTWIRRLLSLAIVLGVVWIVGAIGWSWSQKQYYVGEDHGVVTVFRGVKAELVWIDLSTPYERTSLQVTQLAAYDADQVKHGVTQTSLEAAHRYVAALATRTSAPGAPQ